MSALRSAFSAISRSARTVSVARRAATPVAQISRLNAYRWSQQRGYAAAAGLKREDIENRVLDVIKSFEKVKPELLTPEARFAEDLGLDSLDAVEVVMAVEEEFSIEIPDEEADAIATVKQAIDYIHKTPAAH